MYRYIKLMVLGIFLLGLAACASTTQQYAGPALPADRTALVESGPYTYIESIDGTPTTTLRATVLPGVHTLTMRPDEQNQPVREYIFYSHGPGSVSFEAEAGRRYLVYVDFVHEEGPVDRLKGSGYTWIGYVLDKSTGRKIADTGRLPLGVQPRQPFGFTAPGGVAPGGMPVH